MSALLHPSLDDIIHICQNLLGLFGDVGPEIIRDLSGKKCDVANANGLAHAGAGFQAFQGQSDYPSFQSLSVVVDPAPARELRMRELSCAWPVYSALR